MHATTIGFTVGGSAPVNAEVVTFDGLDHNTPSPYVAGNATFSGWAHGQAPFFTGSQPNCNAAPAGDTTAYLAVGGCGVPDGITVTFAQPVAYVGFLLGSPDVYNVFQFYDGASLLASFTGAQLVPPGDGNQGVASWVWFASVGGDFNRLVITSTSAAAEIDNFASAVGTPEPATFLLIGGGLLAITWRRRCQR